MLQQCLRRLCPLRPGSREPHPVFQSRHAFTPLLTPVRLPQKARRRPRRHSATRTGGHGDAHRAVTHIQQLLRQAPSLAADSHGAAGKIHACRASLRILAQGQRRREADRCGPARRAAQSRADPHRAAEHRPPWTRAWSWGCIHRRSRAKDQPVTPSKASSVRRTVPVAGILHSLQHRIAPAGELFRQSQSGHTAGEQNALRGFHGGNGGHHVCRHPHRARTQAAAAAQQPGVHHAHKLRLPSQAPPAAAWGCPPDTRRTDGGSRRRRPGGEYG